MEFYLVFLDNKGCTNKNARFDCLIKHGSPWNKIDFLDDF
jgi:hypothetical protein